MSSVIAYVCECGHRTVVSVERVDQERDEYTTCGRCNAEVPWDEFTVGGDEPRLEDR